VVTGIYGVQPAARWAPGR